MDIANLLHSLTVAGLSLRLGEADSLQVVGATHKLTLDQQQALRQHKPTLLAMLRPPPPCFIQKEREAIIFADTAEALGPLREAIEYFSRLADDMRFHNAEALSKVVLEPEPSPAPCRRCGNRQTYLAVIHSGESLRRDCAKCGRFVDFVAWHNREESGKILARIAEQSRYNETSQAGDANAYAGSNA